MSSSLSRRELIRRWSGLALLLPLPARADQNDVVVRGPTNVFADLGYPDAAERHEAVRQRLADLYRLDEDDGGVSLDDKLNQLSPAHRQQIDARAAVVMAEVAVTLRYPVVLTRDDNQTVVVTFPDVPGAITYGDTVGEALARAPDALLSVFDARSRRGQDLPGPRSLWLSRASASVTSAAFDALHDTGGDCTPHLDLASARRPGRQV